MLLGSPSFCYKQTLLKMYIFQKYPVLYFIYIFLMTRSKNLPKPSSCRIHDLMENCELRDLL